MTGRAPEVEPHARGWRLLLAAVVVYAVVLVTIAAWRAESSSDFRDFWETAVHFRETGEIASDLGVHNYLPFFTLFMLPWALLPLRVAIVVFSLLSLALFGVTVVLVEHLLSDGAKWRPRPALLIAVALCLPYVHSCVVVGSVSLLLLFLIVASWFLVERGHEWEAGAALGLATLIKLLPAVLIVFFLLKRRWRAAGAAATVAVVLGLGLPLVTLGFHETVAQHRSFYQRAVVEGSAAQTLTSTQPLKTHFNNNALPIVLRRLLSPTNAGRWSQREEFYVNVADFSPGMRLAVFVALLALFGLVSAVVALRRPRPWPPDTIAAGQAVRAQFGVWCCLMLLASPLVWTHYLPLVYWPLALLADRAARTRRVVPLVFVLSVVALGVWALGAVLLAWPAARAAGAQLASVVCVWAAVAALGWERGKPVTHSDG
jgi:hypothetical protein